MPKAKSPKVGDIVLVPIGAAERPAVVTSLNDDGSCNARAFTEPGDNPTNDGNFQTFFRDIGKAPEEPVTEPAVPETGAPPE